MAQKSLAAVALVTQALLGIPSGKGDVRLADAMTGVRPHRMSGLPGGLRQRAPQAAE